MNILKYYAKDSKRVKIFDEDLQLYVNTGEMRGKQALIIKFINKILKPIN